MKGRSNCIKFLMVIIIVASMIIIGCGGSNSDDNDNNNEEINTEENKDESDGSYSEPQYHGETAPAEFSVTNFEAMMTTAFQRTYEIGALDDESNGKNGLSYFEFSDFLYSITEQSIKAYIDDSILPSLQISDAIKKMDGACGGSVNISLEALESIESKSMSLSATFSDYCLNEFCSYENIFINGSVIITGDISISESGRIEIYSISASFNDLLISSTYNVLYLNGQMEISASASNTLLNVNLTWEDLISEETYKIENMRYEMSSTDGTTSISFSGRFYHPAYGNFDINTEDAFIINETGEIISGSIVGHDQYGASARLTVVDTYSYHVEADLDGDGIYERSTEVD